MPSFLHVFASLGGLALIAEHLPIVYHDIPRHVIGASNSQSEKNGEGGVMSWHSNTPEHWGSQGIVEEEDVIFFLFLFNLYFCIHLMYHNVKFQKRYFFFIY